ncbi:hypothetical protein ACTG9Q_20155 [Actinokineospora sp. 24-640]
MTWLTPVAPRPSGLARPPGMLGGLRHVRADELAAYAELAER